MEFPIDEVKKWFLENKRSFPWRERPTPYRVWVSEIMLQQTIASVVVAYFERWMECFPNIETLANASLEEVIKQWEGLGYYARARHLHKGAQYILAHFEGKIPKDIEKISQIPGIGPYTSGAILSFAFHQKYPAIDGNVTRVIARYLAICEEVENSSVKNAIFSYVNQILPQKESWITSEALIELGATICKKVPLCQKCPLMFQCQSFKEGLQLQLPKKRKRPAHTHLYRIVAFLEYEDSILVKKGEEGKVMGNLYEFPYIEILNPPVSDEEALSLLSKEYTFTYLKTLSIEKHTFTRFHATLYPFHLKSFVKTEGIWIKKDKLRLLSFSSGHRRLLNQVLA